MCYFVPSSLRAEWVNNDFMGSSGAYPVVQMHENRHPVTPCSREATTLEAYSMEWLV